MTNFWLRKGGPSLEYRRQAFEGGGVSGFARVFPPWMTSTPHPLVETTSDVYSGSCTTCGVSHGPIATCTVHWQRPESIVCLVNLLFIRTANCRRFWGSSRGNAYGARTHIRAGQACFLPCHAGDVASNPPLPERTGQWLLEIPLFPSRIESIKHIL